LGKTLENLFKEREKIKTLASIYGSLFKAITNVIRKIRTDDPSDFGFLKLLERKMIPSLNGHLNQIS
jgi:hypothetical protein